VSVTVGESAIISFGQRSILNVRAQIVQIGCQRGFPVVVVHFTIRKLDVADGEIEDIRMARTFARRRGGQIVFAIRTDLHVNHRMVDQKFSQRNLVMKYGNDLGSDCELVGMQ